jgi:Molybdopterin-binding domain of aldehyde dehydrogenase
MPTARVLIWSGDPLFVASVSDHLSWRDFEVVECHGAVAASIPAQLVIVDTDGLPPKWWKDLSRIRTPVALLLISSGWTDFDAELGLPRVARIVSAVDAGRILNENLARSQIIGGAVMGIGMTMLEQTVFDPDTGRIANATFGDYLIPTNADVADLDVVFVGTPDTVRPLGIKGIGEIGVMGVSAAIANAVYHATGRRIRSLPITVEQLL